MKIDLYFDFQDKNVFISGASRGIGREVAILFAQSKANLILTETQTNLKQLNEFAEFLITNYQVEILQLELDISQVSQINKVVDEAMNYFGKIDVLVNNAGINQYTRAVQIQEEEWDRILDVNLKGTFFMSQSVGKIMIGQNSGCIVNIASQHGVIGNENRAHYCSSKAGIINMTKALAYEWARYGIRVNAVSPTFVITEHNQDYLNDRSVKKKYVSQIPLGVYAEPSDVAYSVAFLASNVSKMITGHNLLVDGGWTAI